MTFAIPENKLPGARPEKTIGLFSLALLALFAGAGIAALLAIRNAKNLGCIDFRKQVIVLISLWIGIVLCGFGSQWMQVSSVHKDIFQLVPTYLHSVSILGTVVMAAFIFSRQTSIYVLHREAVPASQWTMLFRVPVLILLARIFDVPHISLVLTAGRLWV